MKHITSSPDRIFYGSLSISVGLFILYCLSATLGFVHSQDTLHQIGLVSGWCERIAGGIFREPVNSLSNLSYVIVGLLIIKTLTNDAKASHIDNTFHGLKTIALIYAYSVILIGFGSMFMHGTQTRWGGWADNFGMVAYIVIPWLLNVSEMGRWSPKRFIYIYIVGMALYGASRWFFGKELGINLDIFEVSIGLWFISEFLYRFWSKYYRWLSGLVGFVVAAVFGIMPNEIFADLGNYWWVVLFWLPALISSHSPKGSRRYPWFIFGVYNFFVAYLGWLQGYPDTTYCRPDSLIQPHAIWHLMTAFATWCFFRFLRTQRNY